MTISKGWGWPAQSRKAHYFIDGHSLCGRWLFTGPVDESEAGPDDCKLCARRALNVFSCEAPPLLMARFRL